MPCAAVRVCAGPLFPRYPGVSPTRFFAPAPQCNRRHSAAGVIVTVCASLLASHDLSPD